VKKKSDITMRLKVCQEKGREIFQSIFPRIILWKHLRCPLITIKNQTLGQLEFLGYAMVSEMKASFLKIFLQYGKP
jgi:hypothetical protein